MRLYESAVNIGERKIFIIKISTKQVITRCRLSKRRRWIPHIEK